MEKENKKIGFVFDEDEVEDACGKLQKARFAISEIINEFDSPYELSPHKAVAYGSSFDAGEKYKEDPSYYKSWKYYAEYEKLMWLVHIALDYTSFTHEQLTKILDKK